MAHIERTVITAPKNCKFSTIIMCFCSLLYGPWSSWLNNTPWVLFVASAGGLIVSLGLWLEMGVEKERFKDLRDFRRQHRKEKIGMKVVLAGVILESALGGLLAWHDSEENRKNDPLNIPIKSIRADVFMLVRGQFDNMHVSSEPRQTVNLILLDSGDHVLAVLGCKQLDSWATFIQTNPPPDASHPNGRWFSMEFNWPGDTVIRPPDAEAPPITEAEANSFRYSIDRDNLSVRQLDGERVVAFLEMPLIPDKAEIAWGSCLFTFNGSIRRQFAFPKTADSMKVKLGPMAASP